MFYLVDVDHDAWQCVSPEVTVKGAFKKCSITNAVDETDDNKL